MTAPNQAAHEARVAASTARFAPEQARLLQALRAIGANDGEAGELSSLLEDLRHNARCLASALACGVDPAPFIENLRVLGEQDLQAPQ